MVLLIQSSHLPTRLVNRCCNMKAFLVLLLVAAIQAEDVCICPRFDPPVCGDDGKTYGVCEIGCEQRTRPDLKIAYEGECEVCLCPRFDPDVCATDGKTYGRCELDCLRKLRPEIGFLHDGECDESSENTWVWQ